MKKIKIDTDYIKLDQLLKLANIAQSGGHAKIMILSEQVKVNGETVLERGKKLRSGDVVLCEGEEVQII
ncbi:MAG: RNA-binding S4 domain-containing protein [Peptostreptococcaceae bacterium]|nr:RNA-binding S4 domain-containing protein [Peptostreptococcaceae bacterium]